MTMELKPTMTTELKPTMTAEYKPPIYCRHWVYSNPDHEHKCKGVMAPDLKGLKRHIGRIHLRPLQCGNCTMRFGGTYELKRHQGGVKDYPSRCKGSGNPNKEPPAPPGVDILSKNIRDCKTVKEIDDLITKDGVVVVYDYLFDSQSEGTGSDQSEDYDDEESSESPNYHSDQESEPGRSETQLDIFAYEQPPMALPQGSYEAQGTSGAGQPFTTWGSYADVPDSQDYPIEDPLYGDLLQEDLTLGGTQSRLSLM